MKILIACEESGVVTSAFRHRKHEAYSCDVQPTRGAKQFHYQMDVKEALQDSWDMVISFPPCTHLCSSGARWWKEKREDGRQDEAIEFFMQFTGCAPKVAIENPIGLMSKEYRKPDQIIQPWQFGHGETKATCLWLEGLPLLNPTKIVDGREARVHRMAPGPERARQRSVTYQGIADAMADQWGIGGDHV